MTSEFKIDRPGVYRRRDGEALSRMQSAMADLQVAASVLEPQP